MITGETHDYQEGRCQTVRTRLQWNRMEPHDVLTSSFVRPAILFAFRAFCFVWQLSGVIAILSTETSDRDVHIAITLSFLSDLFNCVYFGGLVISSLWYAKHILRAMNDHPDLSSFDTYSGPSSQTPHSQRVQGQSSQGLLTRVWRITKSHVSRGFTRAQVDSLTWGQKLAWVGSEVLTTTAFVVTLVYWIFIGPKSESAHGYNSLHMHAFNMVTVMVEFILSRWKFITFHVVFVIGITVLYMSIMLIHYARTGYFVYDMLNWKQHSVSAPILWIGLFVAVPLIFLLFVQIAKLRDHIGEKCAESSGETEVMLE